MPTVSWAASCWYQPWAPKQEHPSQVSGKSTTRWWCGWSGLDRKMGGVGARPVVTLTAGSRSPSKVAQHRIVGAIDPSAALRHYCGERGQPSPFPLEPPLAAWPLPGGQAVQDWAVSLIQRLQQMARFTWEKVVHKVPRAHTSAGGEHFLCCSFSEKIGSKYLWRNTHTHSSLAGAETSST